MHRSVAITSSFTECPCCRFPVPPFVTRHHDGEQLRVSRQGDNMPPHVFREQLRKVFSIRLTPVVSPIRARQDVPWLTIFFCRRSCESFRKRSACFRTILQTRSICGSGKTVCSVDCSFVYQHPHSLKTKYEMHDAIILETGKKLRRRIAQRPFQWCLFCV